MQMNSALGKQILALVREGDYAHAGEEEAIHLALAPITRNPAQRLLDAGCGRGGTARYVQDHGWGQVTGFDVEGESIRQARERHPDLSFFVCDVLKAPEAIGDTFDLVYSFNAFYAFPDQPGALRALRSMAQTEGRLMLFDYVDRGRFADSKFARTPEASHWQPLDLKTLPELLTHTGWRIESVRTLHSEYEGWYTSLVHRIESKHDPIVQLAGDAAYDHVHAVYRLLLQAVQAGDLGGAIVHAVPA